MILSALLDKARRRILTQLLLDKGALAATIGLGGTVVLLLAGTAILEWYWVAALVIVSLGVGIYQMRKNVPSQYQLAQRIDRKLDLADTLSTATYFGENPKLGYEAVCQVQRRNAEGLADGVDLQAALPLPRSRYIYPAGAMLLATVGLFILRFAVLGSLDLRPSLIEMAVDSFFATPASEQAKLKAPGPNALRPNAFDPTQPDLPPTPDDLTANIPDNSSKDGGELLNGDSPDKGDAKGDKGDKGLKDGDQKGDDKGDKQGDAKDSQSDKQSDPKDGKDGSENSQDQRSMMDKLRDAVENLMNKMSPRPSDKSAKSDGKQQKGQKGQDKGQKGDEKGERSEGEPQADSGEQGQQSDPQDAKASQAPSPKGSEDAKSGAGANDGEKALKDAKTLEAMGKLSELLGQRANEVTGQVMIEVGNTKQQLRTQFTQQQAGHGEAGSEIHRDEVPLMYQPFIEKYFEEVRKGTEPAPKVAPKKDGK